MLDLKYSENYPPGIKLISDSVVRKYARSYTTVYFNNIKDIVEHFTNKPHDLVVPVCNFQYEEFFNENCGKSNSITDSEINHYEYSYDMKRLFILNKDERSIIDRYLSIYVIRDEREPRVLDIDQNYPELIDFCFKIKKWGAYNDAHNGNFLKDECGDYKLIDLEGFNPMSSWKKENEQ